MNLNPTSDQVILAPPPLEGAAYFTAVARQYRVHALRLARDGGPQADIESMARLALAAQRRADELAVGDE